MQSTTAQELSVFWEGWDVVIDNIDTTQNSFDITEIYDVNFSGTFRYGLQVIADTNLEYINEVMVYENWWEQSNTRINLAIMSVLSCFPELVYE